jgi:uncharacterized protein with von Willebrand factor type A (vWA) domain
VKNIEDKFKSDARTVREGIKHKNKLRGYGSSDIYEVIDKILEVKIPWEELVELAIKSNVITKTDDRTWKQLNKYYINLSLTLPGEYSYEAKGDGIGTLIICVDTSGSISPDDLKKFAHIICKSFKYFENVIVITHDFEVKQKKIFFDENEFLNYIMSIGFDGRGGTSHIDVFSTIDELIEGNLDIEDHYISLDDISMVISLTDCYSDLEEIINDGHGDIKWLDDIPLAIVISEDGTKCEFERKDIKQIKIES